MGLAACIGFAIPSGAAAVRLVPPLTFREAPALRPECCGSSVLYRFRWTKHGLRPLAGLTTDPSGNGVFYGTTSSGGRYGRGTIFKLTPSGTGYEESTLFSFDRNFNGSPGAGSLLVDSTGAVYGTTHAQPTSHAHGCEYCGIVFKLTPTGSTYVETVLHRFSGGSDGAELLGSQGLYEDAGGALYGTTSSGGNSSCGRTGCGIVFKLTPTGSGTYTESVLYRFKGGAGGWSPQSALIADSSGAFYGTAASGGNPNCTEFASGCGIVYELTPNEPKPYKESVIHFFDGNDGETPTSGLTADSQGDFYGIANTYTRYGEVYELMPSSSASGGYAIRVLFDFDGTDGSSPNSVTLCSSAGALCGATADGGENGVGLAFKLNPPHIPARAYVESILHQFDTDDGEMPSGVVIDSGGALYGTTQEGGGKSQTGLDSYGVVFKINVPSGS
jgi:uncharacterized repeat protein (TIGR03803 family)